MEQSNSPVEGVWVDMGAYLAKNSTLFSLVLGLH